MESQKENTGPKEKYRRKYEPPVSLHPLDPKDALKAFLQVDPEKVKERERTEKAGGKKRKGR